MNDPCSRVSREPLPEELLQLGKHVQTRKRVDLLGRNGAMTFSILLVLVSTPLVVSIKCLGLAQSR